MKAVFWAGVGTLFPFLMTITGAALVFLLKNQKEDGPCMGFAAGVMSAAAVFSMLLPAMRQKAGGWLTVTLGFALGAAMIAGVDAFLGRTQRLQGVSASAKRRLMMYAAITLHNIPEGMAVGLAFALAGVEGGFAGAAVLALGIGVQNLPEGLAVALPFRAGGMSRGRSFALGALSGAVEPVFGMLAALALFYLFKGLDLGCVRWVNALAGTTLGVYILHQVPAFRGFLWNGLLQAEAHHGSAGYTLLAILAVVLGCAAVDALRTALVMRPLENTRLFKALCEKGDALAAKITADD